VAAAAFEVEVGVDVEVIVGVDDIKDDDASSTISLIGTIAHPSPLSS